jgi:UDP-N-acetylglucosamine 1-carboxyvinyltransferase
MLKKMGADIEGIGTNTLKIKGVSHLSSVEHMIGPDYLESGSFIGLAALAGNGILIKNAGIQHLRKTRIVFEKLGIQMEFRDQDCFVPGAQELTVRTDMHGLIPVIDDAPWPQFPTDMMSVAIVAATQSRGTVLFFEKMYDGRMFFVDNLVAMGAQIILCDPHRVVVAGPSRLFGAPIESPDIRAGMALLIASLCAEGTSSIFNIRQIDRGYENIDMKLKSLGADIERVPL